MGGSHLVWVHVCACVYVVGLCIGDRYRRRTYETDKNQTKFI